jgi:biotin carboxyl carrier protein
VTILLAIVLSIVITVPTYSSGMGVVMLPGTPITAGGGTVEQVLVTPGQHVKKGQVLLRLSSIEQENDLRTAKTDAENQTTMFLFDLTDDQVKKNLGTTLSRLRHEEAKLEMRLVRAKVEGTVSDLRVRVGQAIAPGDMVLQIVDPKAEPEIWAFLPAKDRPRLRATQILQTEILGYTKSREKSKIYFVSPEAMGASDAAKIIGPQLADALKLAQGGSYVLVKAKLPGKTFKTQHSTLFYHHGMSAKTEVKIRSKPFIVTLLPSLEKYIPD